MNPTQLIGEFAKTLCEDDSASAIRTLDDLEMTIAAGGDGIVVWTPR